MGEALDKLLKSDLSEDELRRIVALGPRGRDAATIPARATAEHPWKAIITPEERWEAFVGEFARRTFYVPKRRINLATIAGMVVGAPDAPGRTNRALADRAVELAAMAGESVTTRHMAKLVADERRGVDNPNPNVRRGRQLARLDRVVDLAARVGRLVDDGGSQILRLIVAIYAVADGAARSEPPRMASEHELSERRVLELRRAHEAALAKHERGLSEQATFIAAAFNRVARDHVEGLARPHPDDAQRVMAKPATTKATTSSSTKAAAAKAAKNKPVASIRKAERRAGPGRPPKAEGERKSAKVLLRMTAAQKAELRAHVGDDDLSSFILDAALAAARGK